MSDTYQGSDGGVSGSSPSDSGAGVSSAGAGTSAAPSAPTSLDGSGLGHGSPPQSQASSGGLRDEPDGEDFLSGFESLEADESSLPTPPAEATSDSNPTQQQPPAPLQAQEPPPGQQPVAPVQEPPQAQGAPGGEVPQPQSLEEWSQFAALNPQAVIQRLAAEAQFQPSNEDLETLQAGDINQVKEVFSRWSAAGHYRATMATMGLINTWVPQIISQVMQSQGQTDKARAAFSAAFPNLDLNKPEVMAAVSDAAARLRKANPQMSTEEAIQRVGNSVSAFFGVPAMVAPPAARPFTPARAGNGMPPPARSEANPWEGLARDYDT